MNFTSLRYFVAVAEELNISKAAKKLFISQQSLSNHINRLESELNIRLFERNPRLSLTYAGICLMRISRQILDLERQIHTQIDDIANEQSGSLSVGLTRIRARTILPQVLPVFNKRFPQIEVHTTITDNSILQKKLLSGELDLIICNNPTVNEVTAQIPLFKDKFCVIVPRRLMVEKYPDTCDSAIRAYQSGLTLPKEFFDGAPILMSSGTRVRFAADSFLQKLGVSPRIVMETNDIETLFSLSECGMGITFSYEKYAQKSLAISNTGDGVPTALIFPVHDDSLCGDIKLSFRRDRYMTRSVRQFIEVSQEILSDKQEAAFSDRSPFSGL